MRIFLCVEFVSELFKFQHADVVFWGGVGVVDAEGVSFKFHLNGFSELDVVFFKEGHGLRLVRESWVGCWELDGSGAFGNSWECGACQHFLGPASQGELPGFEPDECARFTTIHRAQQT